MAEQLALIIVELLIYFVYDVIGKIDKWITWVEAVKGCCSFTGTCIGPIGGPTRRSSGRRWAVTSGRTSWTAAWCGPTAWPWTTRSSGCTGPTPACKTLEKTDLVLQRKTHQVVDLCIYRLFAYHGYIGLRYFFANIWTDMKWCWFIM